MPDDRGLRYPSIRTELLEVLDELADAAFMRSVIDAPDRPTDALDSILDFFDDSGAMDEPHKRIGLYLVNVEEAAAMQRLADGFEAAVRSRAADRWLMLVPAARLARDLLAANGS